MREHPLREGLRGLLMLALYRSGRQADALAAYQDARDSSCDELGLDPGQALQRSRRRSSSRTRRSTTAAAAAPIPPPSVAEREQPAEPSARRPSRERARTAQGRDGDVRRRHRLRRARRVARSGGVARAARRVLRADEGGRRAPRRRGREAFIGDAVDGRVRAAGRARGRRATRAAGGGRDARAPSSELGIEGRIGVESGEVVVGPPSCSVTGRASRRQRTARARGATRRDPAREAARMELSRRRRDRRAARR